MTAAHCVPENEDSKKVSVYTYQGCNKSDIFTGTEYKVYRIWRNSGYREPGSGNDIALLRLEWPINGMMPICLPNDTRKFKNLMAAGWGDMDEGVERKESDCLRQVEMEPVSDTTCRKVYPKITNMKKIMCAGGETGVCDGDDGSALMSRDSTDGLYYQVGIASFGRKDCGIATESPSAFERIVPHIDWIREKAFFACFK